MLLAAIILLLSFSTRCSTQEEQPTPVSSTAIQGPDVPASAVIVDQLAISFPNPDFVKSATEILQKAGYRVIYVDGEEATVDFFRYLPSQAYDIIILRAHSSTQTMDQDGNIVQEAFTSISTGEPASDKYSEERNSGRLGGFLLEQDDQVRFTIRPGFIEQDMVGDFDGAVIVMMGCDGMRVLGTAQSLLDKGAGAVIGWNGEVSVNHTDKATEFLIQQYAIEKKTITDAVDETRSAIGPDPIYNVNMALWATSK
jgi:hypothetical protein